MSRSFAGFPVRVVKKGTRLYHGTSHPEGIGQRDLRGPMWVTDGLATARWFARWRYDEREPHGSVPRVMAFTVKVSIPLPVIHARPSATGVGDFDRFTCEVVNRAFRRFGIGRGDDYDPRFGRPSVEDTVEALCALGLHGWFLTGNYADGAADIVLCDPARWLRRVQAKQDRFAAV